MPLFVARSWTLLGLHRTRAFASIPALIADASAILAVSTPEEESGASEEGSEVEASEAATESAASGTKKSPAKRAGGKPTPAERRASAKALLHLWRGVAR